MTGIATPPEVGWRLRTPLGFGGLSVLLVLALAMPYTSGGWVREAAVILFYFPLIVVLGAGGESIATFGKPVPLFRAATWPIPAKTRAALQRWILSGRCWTA
jgi:hypothetical protein